MRVKKVKASADRKEKEHKDAKDKAAKWISANKLN